ncbi:MAG: metallophosphoesterase [Treponema sp.]|nr:metallophosphoesterase [Treponema sp.]
MHDGKKSKLRIVQISDFHSNDYGEHCEKIVNKVRELSPDVIFLTGDIFDFDRPQNKSVQNVKELLNGIKELCPFYYVSGNHEYYTNHNDEYSFLIEEYGGVVLKNTAALFITESGNVIVAGVDDPFADIDGESRDKALDDRASYKKRLLLVKEKAELLKNEDTLFTVLLAHRPEYAEDYAELGFDFVFSGHAHGGQWRFPGINGLYAPNQGMFPEYAGGQYELKKDGSETVMIVSRGLSYQSPRIPRIMNSPEIVVVDVNP